MALTSGQAKEIIDANLSYKSAYKQFTKAKKLKKLFNKKWKKKKILIL